MKRYLLYLLLTVSLVFQPAFAGISLASETSKEEKKLEELEENQKDTKKKLDQSAETLKQRKAEVQKIEAAIVKLDEEIATLDEQNKTNEESLNKQKQQLEKRVVSIYQKGEMGFMVQLLQSENFSQFLARLQGIRLIVKNDSAILEKIQQKKNEIDQAKAQIVKKKKEQEPLLAEAGKKLEAIETLVADLKSELSDIEGDVEATKEQIAEKNAAVKAASASYTGNLGSGILMKPSPGPITSGFGYRWGRPHQGIDIGGGMGAPIYAADSGVVTLIKSNPGGYGIYIVVSHGNGLSTLYAHMYRHTITVSQGQKVQKGQKIAEVGNNGRSTGPHLHFEVHKNGTPVNPMPYLN